MLRDTAFDLSAVDRRALATSPWYHVRDVVVPPVIPPPQKAGGGGGPWRRVEPRPRPRPALHFKHVASGGVAVGGEGGNILLNGVDLRQRWRNQSDEDFLFFGLLE